MILFSSRLITCGKHMIDIADQISSRLNSLRLILSSVSTKWYHLTLKPKENVYFNSTDGCFSNIESCLI